MKPLSWASALAGYKQLASLTGPGDGHPIAPRRPVGCRVRRPHAWQGDVTVTEAFGTRMTSEYLYDFGDRWWHRVKVEKILTLGSWPRSS